MNRYIVFYQNIDNDLLRTYDEIDAISIQEAQNTILNNYLGVTVISVWEKVT